MTMFLAPYTAIADINGSPLDAGFLFFGEYGKDPELFPVEVFWDADFTVPAAQPIRTRNGYPIRNGSPCKIYLKQAEHSLVIKNKNLSTILAEIYNKGISSSALIRPNGETIEESLTQIGNKLDQTRDDLETKANETDVQVRLDDKANSVDVYKKAETFTRTEIAAAIAPKANKADVDAALSNLSTTANKYYSTLADATADIANIALNQSVTIDEAENGGLWYKATADATSLTKSAYDPLTQSKQYADDRTKKANYILQGQLTKFEYVASTNSYLISHTDLVIRRGAGRGFVKVGAVTDLVVPQGAAYYVDLNGLSLSSSHTLEGQIATGWASSSHGTGTFVDDLKYVFFAWNDIPARFGGYLLQNGLIDTLNPKFAALTVQNRKNSYIVQGKITSASYNASAQEWTISHTRIVIMLGSGRGRVSVDAREDVVVKNNGCYYVDLLGATAGAILIGAVATGWASSSHGTGTFVDDMKLPLFVTTGTSGQTHGGYLVQNGGLPTISTSTAVDTINATKAATNLDFYIKGSGNNYIKYTLIKHDNPTYDPANVYSRRQLWRLGAMSEVNPSKVVVRDAFVTGGENELAISSPGGWSDAVGGFHGDEIYTKAYFIVDGRHYTEDAVFSGDFKEIRFIQESDLLEGTATGAVFAKHIKNYSFTKDGLRLEQTVKFVNDINIRNIWLGSLCIRRNLDGATGELITSTAIYPTNEVVDVSIIEGFERIARPIKVGQTMTITGDVGLSAEITVLNTNSENYNVHVHNDATYNKLYFNALQYSNTEVLSNAISAGTEFTSTLLYKINTLN